MRPSWSNLALFRLTLGDRQGSPKQRAPERARTDGQSPKHRANLRTVEGFLPAWSRFSEDNPLRHFLKRLEEAQEPPPSLSDPYRAVYPERREAERHVRLVDPADARPGWEWPTSWEQERKLRKGRQSAGHDPIKAAYGERQSSARAH